MPKSPQHVAREIEEAAAKCQKDLEKIGHPFFGNLDVGEAADDPLCLFVVAMVTRGIKSKQACKGVQAMYRFHAALNVAMGEGWQANAKVIGGDKG